MSVKLLTEHHLGFLSLKDGYTGWSEPTLVKMPHCWKSHVTAQLSIIMIRSRKFRKGVQEAGSRKYTFIMNVIYRGQYGHTFSKGGGGSVPFTL